MIGTVSSGAQSLYCCLSRVLGAKQGNLDRSRCSFTPYPLLFPLPVCLRVTLGKAYASTVSEETQKTAVQAMAGGI